ncbi:MAG: hypothetical protein AB1894_23655 [Chloroflexota bacterium]
MQATRNPIAWRMLLACLIGLVSGGLCCLNLARREQLAADFTWPWRAANFLLEGKNPYIEIQPEGDYPFQTYFYYPLPAALAALPFAGLPAYLAGALFFGLSSGLLAWALLQDGWQRLPLFLSAPYVVAAATAQWTPLIVAAGLLPAMNWLLACKPNLGLALFIYKPNKLGLALGLVFVALSLACLPSWPWDWLAVTKQLAGHPPPFLVLPLGPLLLLAALRWRKAGARLLLGLSLLPQLLFFYDQLPLWLLPRSFRAGLAYSALSWLAYFAWRWQGIDPHTGEILLQPVQYILALVYLPALLMLLWPEGKKCRWWRNF